ncbi:MAG: DUF6597 domain-containing transcriptional factor, partial [Bryobacteraceae bacterium]
MRSSYHSPQPPLSEFIYKFWLFEGYTAPHAKERLLPDGTVQLIFNLKEDRVRVYDRNGGENYESISGSLVSGAHSQYFVIDTAEQSDVLGVHFRPGGAFPFLGMPAGELRNRQVGLQDLWGREASELRERLLAARTH